MKKVKCLNDAVTITFVLIKMIIAVDTGFLLNNGPAGYRKFLSECLRHITKDHPEHSFVFIFNKKHNNYFFFTGNVTPVVIGPAANNFLLRKFWYDVKIPPVLKKHKTDVFLCGSGLCSLSTRIPQYLLIPDLSFIHHSKFLKKAKIIFTFSEFIKNEIISSNKTEENKIKIIPVAASEIFHPLTAEEKEAVKHKLTGGKEYFVCTETFHQQKKLVSLLKSFSVFKKMQHSNWKLVLTGNTGKKYKNFADDLKTYKYREDIVLTGMLTEEEFSKVVGAAYSRIYIPLKSVSVFPVLETMQAGVALITSEITTIREIAKDAALYVNPDEYEDIAAKMMQIYKDEKLRTELIEKGKTLSRQYSFGRSAEILWQYIVNAATA